MIIINIHHCTNEYYSVVQSTLRCRHIRYFIILHVEITKEAKHH